MKKLLNHTKKRRNSRTLLNTDLDFVEDVNIKKEKVLILRGEVSWCVFGSSGGRNYMKCKLYETGSDITCFLRSVGKVGRSNIAFGYGRFVLGKKQLGTLKYLLITFCDLDAPLLAPIIAINSPRYLVNGLNFVGGSPCNVFARSKADLRLPNIMNHFPHPSNGETYSLDTYSMEDARGLFGHLLYDASPNSRRNTVGVSPVPIDQSARNSATSSPFDKGSPQRVLGRRNSVDSGASPRMANVQQPVARKREDIYRLKYFQMRYRNAERLQLDLSAKYFFSHFLDFHEKIGSEKVLLISTDRRIEPRLDGSPPPFVDGGMSQEMNGGMYEKIAECVANKSFPLDTTPHNGVREFIVVHLNLRVDPDLYRFIVRVKQKYQRYFAKFSEYLSSHESSYGDYDEKVFFIKKKVCDLVQLCADRLGGFGNSSLQDAVRKELLRVRDKNTGMVYLGKMKLGLCRHRSILFKLMCDSIGLPCRLIRGYWKFNGVIMREYAWNIIHLGFDLYMVDVENSTLLMDSSEYLDKNTSDHYSRIGEGTIGGKTLINTEKYARSNLLKYSEVAETGEKKYLAFHRADPRSTDADTSDGPAVGGAFGDIYRHQVWNEYSGEVDTVVVKEINVTARFDVDIWDDNGGRCYVEKEVRLMKFLNHKNCVYLIDSWFSYVDKDGKIVQKYEADDIMTLVKDGGCILCCIVMKNFTMNGKDLCQIWKKSSMSAREKKQQAIIFLFELAQGLQYMHSINVLHLDVKPANVLVILDEAKRIVEVRLTDFGASKELLETYLSYCPFRTCGYTAPECMRGEKFDARADVYSFGRIMKDVSKFLSEDLGLLNLMKRCYEALPKRRPFMREVVKELYIALLEARLRRVDESS